MAFLIFYLSFDFLMVLLTFFFFQLFSYLICFFFMFLNHIHENIKRENFKFKYPNNGCFVILQFENSVFLILFNLKVLIDWFYIRFLLHFKFFETWLNWFSRRLSIPNPNMNHFFLFFFQIFLFSNRILIFLGIFTTHFQFLNFWYPFLPHESTNPLITKY
jgi:hypothetical protein